VPADKIQARYARTLANLPGAIEAASMALLLDNDLAEAPYRFVALFDNGSLVRSSDLAPEWAKAVLR
jgi:predicted ABC-type ATPase